MPKRQLIGKIISNKMSKTVAVEVETIKEHRIYRKKYKMHKKYLADVANEKDYRAGDRVIIQECRPLSKRKKWKVVKRLD